MKMKKKSLRFVAGVLAVTMLISSNSVFATTTAEYDEQIESIKSQQAENEAEAERLNEKLDSLRDQTSEAEAYQATLEEQITTYQTSIDLAVQNITQLNTNITNLEAEIKKADEEYADTFAELKVRLRSLYASGGNLTTLQILFDSTSLYDFSMRSEAMKTITKHDRELMEKIRLYRIQTQDQRDELNKEKEELADQKKEDGDALVTTVLFDHRYIMVHDGVDIKEVQNLTDKEYRPEGMTAMLDAVGRTINHVGNRLADMPEEERPEKVVFTIITDGCENASHEFNWNTVKEMIKHQREKYSWVFTFLGANIDTMQVSSDLGISSMLSKTYRASKSGTEKVFSAASKSVSVARGVSADALNSAQTMCFMSSALDEAEEE